LDSNWRNGQHSDFNRSLPNVYADQAVVTDKLVTSGGGVGNQDGEQPHAKEILSNAPESALRVPYLDRFVDGYNEMETWKRATEQAITKRRKALAEIK